METTARRRVPFIVVAGREGTAALVESLRAQGAIVYQTRTPDGCLRVATAVRPDIIVLPREFPRRLVLLLEQHPTSAGARIVWSQRSATGDAVALDEEGAAIVKELAESADQRVARPRPVQPLHRAPVAHENVVSESAGDPAHYAPARQVTAQDLLA
jgi:hypothetical protein